MPNFIVQLRRGTAEEWATTGSDIVPLAGELVLEIDDTGKNLHRLKIGDGQNVYANLPYISVDSFILPKPTSITLVGGNAWIQDVDVNGDPIEDRYHQIVTIENGIVTSNSKVDIQLTPEQLCLFHDKDITFTTINENGIVTVYAVGPRLENTYTVQVTIAEVILNA